MTTVLLVDDQQLVRSGFRMILDSQPDVRVVAEAGSGAEAVAAVAAHPVDVVLMDVRMPDLDGIEATRRITAAHPETRVIVLTTFDLDEYVLSAIHAGASGFLLKDTAPEDLLAAIRSVASGDAVISPSMTRRLLSHVAPMLSAPNGAGDTSGGAAGSTSGGADANDAILQSTSMQSTSVQSSLGEVARTLTAREVEVLERIADGCSNAEIAEQLQLSEATVKTHVAHILSKTNSRDRVQAVIFAYESGLVALR